MKSLFIKEITEFFSSALAYLFVIVFLVGNGLFLWVLPTSLNIFDGGYATLDAFFVTAPLFLLFLVPAISMRTFSSDILDGNLDLLLTRPITEFQLVLSKFFAVVVISTIVLLPTLFFYFSVNYLGQGSHPVDSGATWGSYLGLLMLASAFASIGVFNSSLTSNSIISVILSLAICFLLYYSFNLFGFLSQTGSIGKFIVNLGFYAHYKSMSRGVIDSRDLVYFLSVIVLFLLLTHFKLKSRKW